MTRRNGLMAAWLALTLVPSIASAGTPAEQRCNELGATCVCSEPLDFVSSSIPSGYDFPDSEGLGAKECNGGVAFQLSSGTQSTVPGTSVGLGGVANVLQITMYNNAYIEDSSRDFTNGTWCQRHYFRFSPGYAVIGQTGIKGPRNNSPPSPAPHPGLQTHWEPSNGSLRFAPGYGNSSFCTVTPCGSFGPDIGPRVGTEVTTADCTTSWCRLELCYDHNDNGQQKLRWRGRLTQISTGHSISVNALSPNSSSTAISGLSHLFKTFIESAGAWTAGEHVWASHVMVAIKQPADPNFWIGPAREIPSDPAGSSGSTTPPPATAPPAPVLLP